MLASAQCRPASCQAAVREIRAAPIPPAARPWELLTHSYGGSTGRNIATAFLFLFFPSFSFFLFFPPFFPSGLPPFLPTPTERSEVSLNQQL